MQNTYHHMNVPLKDWILCNFFIHKLLVSIQIGKKLYWLTYCYVVLTFCVQNIFRDQQKYQISTIQIRLKHSFLGLEFNYNRHKCLALLDKLLTQLILFYTKLLPLRSARY